MHMVSREKYIFHMLFGVFKLNDLIIPPYIWLVFPVKWEIFYILLSFIICLKHAR